MGFQPPSSVRRTFSSAGGDAASTGKSLVYMEPRHSCLCAWGKPAIPADSAPISHGALNTTPRIVAASSRLKGSRSDVVASEPCHHDTRIASAQGSDFRRPPPKGPSCAGRFIRCDMRAYTFRRPDSCNPRLRLHAGELPCRFVDLQHVLVGWQEPSHLLSVRLRQRRRRRLHRNHPSPTACSTISVMNSAELAHRRPP